MDPNYRRGLFYALGAFVLWGVAPAYFKLIQQVPAAEIIVHRVIWSAVLIALVLLLSRRFVGWRHYRDNPRLLATLALSSSLITANWLIFVFAVNSGHLLDASLGYYINPIINVLLAVLFLGERLRLLQLAAVLLACLGVAYQVYELGRLPWVSLALALTFGFYGLLRKRVLLDALNGLGVETALMVPLALAYLVYLWSSGTAQFGHVSLRLDLLLMAAGVVTTIPLALFAAGAQRLPYTTIGFLQYISPSLAIVLAVGFYGEHFGQARAITFGLIWLGLLLFSWDAWRAQKAPAV
ncbi:EamA family transporter RarD [Tahibacter harae]|uniref:EamA family transporter RarD n=1 Tax=Tahibacter harae TaxID=2963937 RepID=A0ABT1QPJ3_9GAMM|nr:EamA family transporter RarD [Tahibacter harae]